MKRIVIGFLVTVALAGCSQAPSVTSDPVAPQALTAITPSQVPAAQPAAPLLPSPSADVSYPEKIDVERLLFRARELEHKHEFQNALALVTEALGLDPHSPSAFAMKSRLEEILKTI